MPLGRVYKGEKLLDIRANQVRRIIPKTLPRHVYPFAEFMLRQSQKPLTRRDVVKAYAITVSSIQRQAIGDPSVRERWPGYPGAYGKGVQHRPETQMARLLVATRAGHDYLNAAERGKLDRAALDQLLSKFRPDLQPTLRRQLAYIATHSDPVLTAIKKPRKRWLRYVAQNVHGIGYAKAGFFSALLGRGDIPTADAREISFWTCPKGRWNPKIRACCIDRDDRGRCITPPRVDVNPAFVEALSRKLAALRIRMPSKYRPFYQHLVHHVVWDAVGGSKTQHKTMRDAMELACPRKP